ncbi:MAG TPA: site-2 protease family protein [Solirubrobacteraceae bacterium]|nr:site-2 protease family protein [Solirubrobacteraceae bacterium]
MSTWLPPVAPAPEPPAPSPPAPEPSRAKRWFGPLFAIGLVIIKLGAKLKVLLLLLPKLKVLTTSASMLVSVAAYALIWGWSFAAGFVALLFVHEMGHVIQMKREGVKVSGMLFVPFLGAAVGARSMGGNALAEARIGLAGPVLGTLATAALIPIAEAQDSDFLRALAFTGFFLNLFNLAPVVPLDGGRAMAAMAPWMWFAGFAAMLGFFVLFPNPILVLILLLGGMETWRRWKTRKQGLEGNEAYYRVKPVHRLAVAAAYVALIAICAVGMDLTFIDRTNAI